MALSVGCSSSGTTTTCDPKLAPDYFNTATPVTSALLNAPPCPAGFGLKLSPGLGGRFVRFTTEADFVAQGCFLEDRDAGTADAGDASVGVDFATMDLIVLTYAGTQDSEAPPLLARGTEYWFRFAEGCPTGGAGSSPLLGFYVVPKGKAIQTEMCVTTCACTHEPCQLP